MATQAETVRTPADCPGLIVVSNRGPLSFIPDGGGGVIPGPTPGGLVTALAPTLGEYGARWLSAPMTDLDRQAARAGRTFRRASLAAHFVDVDPAAYRLSYEVVANSVLWPLFHGLLEPVRQTTSEVAWTRSWRAYREVNAEFAKAIANCSPPHATVLVQDYHLLLVGQYLRLLRPDLRGIYFSHTPLCSPDELRELPVSERFDLIEGLAAYRACGFHARAWEGAYRACCEEMRVAPPRTFVQPLGVHQGDLARLSQSPECAEAGRQIDVLVGDKALIVRVDRLDPTKNLLGGFEAFSRLLEHRPRLRGRVVFLAHAVPSRECLPAMRRHRHEVEQLVQRINARWARPGWMPISLQISNDRARATAALCRYDVLLVNAVRDGMNLVALEGALTNRRDGVLVLSRRTGTWEQLSEVAWGIDPFDEVGTAAALERALDLTAGERAERAERACHAAGALQPEAWLAALLAEASDPGADASTSGHGPGGTDEETLGCA